MGISLGSRCALYTGMHYAGQSMVITRNTTPSFSFLHATNHTRGSVCLCAHTQVHTTGPTPSITHCTPSPLIVLPLVELGDLESHTNLILLKHTKTTVNKPAMPLH